MSFQLVCIDCCRRPAICMGHHSGPLEGHEYRGEVRRILFCWGLRAPSLHAAVGNRCGQRRFRGRRRGV